MKKICLKLVLTVALLSALSGCSKRSNLIEQAIGEKETESNISAVNVSADNESADSPTIETAADSGKTYYLANSIQQAYMGDLPVACCTMNGECMVVTMGITEKNEYKYWMERIDSSGSVKETELTSIAADNRVLGVAGATDVSYLISAEERNETDGTEGGNVSLTVFDRDGNLISQSVRREMRYSQRGLNAGSFQADCYGRLWLYLADTQQLECIDQNGSTVFEIGLEGEPFVRLTAGRDGTLFGVFTDRSSGDSYIRKIDPDEGNLKGSYPISLNKFDAIYPGLHGTFFVEESNVVSEYYPESGKQEQLFSYLENGIELADVLCVMGTESEQILVISQKISEKKLQIDILDKDIQEYAKSFITIASMNPSEELKELVTLYNRTNKLYCISIKAYGNSESSTADEADAFTRLQADLVNGTAGDILDLNVVTDYMTREQLASLGVLENLDPWLQNDPLIDPEQYTQAVWDANRINGNLYNLVPFYEIRTVFGRESEFGDSHSCSLEQIFAANDPVTVYGRNHTWKEIMRAYCLYILEGSEEHINQVLADRESLCKLLEFAKNYPAEYDEMIETASDVYYGKQRLVAGEKIGRNLFAYTVYQAAMGEKITCIGYPTAEGVGSSFLNSVSLGMCADSQGKEIVWDFFRFLISESTQGDTERLLSARNNIPVYRAEWKEMLAPEVHADGDTKDGMGVFREDVTWYVTADWITQDIIDEIETLIGEIHKVDEVDPQLYQIILDEAGEFFYDRCGAEEAADHMINRVRIYLDERAE